MDKAWCFRLTSAAGQCIGLLAMSLPDRCRPVMSAADQFIPGALSIQVTGVPALDCRPVSGLVIGHPVMSAAARCRRKSVAVRSLVVRPACGAARLRR